MKRCIIVQGPAYSNSISQIRQCWKGWDIIYSTWKGYEGLHTEDEIVIYSALPHSNGVKNLNYQKVSTLAGLNMAKELGYERALKWRSDMWTNNAEELLSKFTDGYNTLFWHEHAGGYLSDYWMEDTIDNLINIWDIEPNGAFPEKVLTDRIQQLGLMNRVNLLISELNNDMDIFWNTSYGPYWMNILNNETIYKNNITWKRN
jgi:predicted Rdx family selenoprotein